MSAVDLIVSRYLDGAISESEATADLVRWWWRFAGIVGADPAKSNRELPSNFTIEVNRFTPIAEGRTSEQIERASAIVMNAFRVFQGEFRERTA